MTDQYGRLFAVFIFAPYLIYSGYKYKDHILIILGILLFCYECFLDLFFRTTGYLFKKIIYINIILYIIINMKIFNYYNTICYTTI